MGDAFSVPFILSWVIIGLGFQSIGSIPFFFSSIPIPCFSFIPILAIHKTRGLSHLSRFGKANKQGWSENLISFKALRKVDQGLAQCLLRGRFIELCVLLFDSQNAMCLHYV